MEYRRCQPPCVRFIASDDPHVSVLNVWGFRMHAMQFTGYQNANFVKISVSEPSGSRLEVLEKESSVFSRRAPH